MNLFRDLFGSLFASTPPTSILDRSQTTPVKREKRNKNYSPIPSTGTKRPRPYTTQTPAAKRANNNFSPTYLTTPFKPQLQSPPSFNPRNSSPERQEYSPPITNKLAKSYIIKKEALSKPPSPPHIPMRQTPIYKQPVIIDLSSDSEDETLAPILNSAKTTDYEYQVALATGIQHF
jgi:hypothetical protein